MSAVASALLCALAAAVSVALILAPMVEDGLLGRLGLAAVALGFSAMATKVAELPPDVQRSLVVACAGIVVAGTYTIARACRRSRRK